ncbi:class I adenylate-forming enzyme family protein [Nereida sp. MMG025]|uniref:class I adenylate-forming enzyme family protein n=1 Tax=Nereida sp. MMG025 TaxID=2909981 RepID=UPI001F16AF84|nr:class I adenylate-forming enzyme family protein [Nereida sp. MMG025]MCF6443286.1 acyl--CoA ligase [Nereida sp. MMG025]
MQHILPYDPVPPCPAPFNMAAHVLAAAKHAPDKTAIAILGDDPQTLTFAQLSRCVFGVARGLQNSGLMSGDQLLMRMGNRIEFPIVYLGAIAAGIIPVPTSAQLTQTEVDVIATQIGAAAVLRSDDLPIPPDVPCYDIQTIQSWYDLPPLPPQMGDPDRPAYIVFTSGTSAAPRAVLHAHRAIWARQMMLGDWTGIHANDRVLHAGGFNWTYTLGTGLMDPWSVGATALIAPDGLDPAHLPQTLRDNKISVFAAVPGIYRQILKHHMKMNDASTIRFLSAGEKLSEGLRDKWQKATGASILEAYGMSECSTFLSDRPAQPHASGLRPQSGRRIAITQNGTIAVHRSDPGLMLGYLNQPQATAARFQGDWFDTGDQAELADDGSLRLMGRSDDMMNAGGYRVSPLDVENTLARVDGIDEIAVTDVQIKEDVRVIAAFYTSPAPLPQAQLEQHARTHLARYKQPRLYIQLETLPKGANNKILRGQLRSAYEAQNGQT